MAEEPSEDHQDGHGQDDDSPSGVPDDLSDLTPDDIPDDLSQLDERSGTDGLSGIAEGPVDQRSTWTRLAERYIELRAATMNRDGGPGVVLRWSARAPLISTLLLAIVVGAVLVVTFGVPPISPLFLIPVVCGPVYPWLRLESRAQQVWRGRQAP